MGATSIQWTDETWNPVTGCTKVSQGCKHCYAERLFPRVYGRDRVTEAWEAGITLERAREFTDVRTHEERLVQPLGWRKPRRVFVNSMSDLFHEDVPPSFILRVWMIMMHAGRHTFQILTKRPDRMLSILTSASFSGIEPMPHIWLGVSVEDQATADERIPLLLQTPAAVRFVSYEPSLGPVDFTRISLGKSPVRTAWSGDDNEQFKNVEFTVNALKGARTLRWPSLDWIIVGGESGPKARPCDVDWIRSTIAQCKAAGVACFVKQLGANVRDRNDAGFNVEEEVWAEGPDAGKPTNRSGWPSLYHEVEHNPNGYLEEYQGAPVRIRLRDRAGGDQSEWPEDLRVREFPGPNNCPMQAKEDEE